MVDKGATGLPGTQVLLLDAGPMISAFTAPAFTVEEVLANPKLLKGWGQEQVEAEIGTTAGWRGGKRGQGSQKGQGWMLRVSGLSGWIMHESQIRGSCQASRSRGIAESGRVP